LPTFFSTRRHPVTIVHEGPANPTATAAPRLLITDDPATELGDGQRIVYAESAGGEVLVIVDGRMGRLGSGEKYILLNIAAGPMLAIVDEDEFFFGPDTRGYLAPPVTGEPY
jgi:hypothetical protein